MAPSLRPLPAQRAVALPHTDWLPCAPGLAFLASCLQSEAEETTEKWGLEAGLFKVFTAKADGGAAGGGAAPSKGAQAKALLARYGSAYLITSISFAVVSMAACYLAVDSGVDVAALLQRFGLQVGAGLVACLLMLLAADVGWWWAWGGLGAGVGVVDVSPPAALHTSAPPCPPTPAEQVTDSSEKVGTFAIAYAAHKALSPVRFPPTVALTPLVAKWLGKEPAPEGAASE